MELLITRKEIEEFIKTQFDGTSPRGKGQIKEWKNNKPHPHYIPFHYGKIELKELLDFIFNKEVVKMDKRTKK